MASKKYIGKPCAYCDGDKIATTADPVVARQFFLEEDRLYLPKVPACKECNRLKSELENYALAVLPLASRHSDARAYSEANIGRRLRRNDALRRRLTLQHSGVWEPQKSGLLLPIMSVPVDEQKINGLFGFIVKGLFKHHWGTPLNGKWVPDVTVIEPEHESHVFFNITRIMGPTLDIVQGDFGRGTFGYWGARGSAVRWFSGRQFVVFGGLQFSNAHSPTRAFAKLSAVTRPDMSRVPFTDEEAGASVPAAA